MNSSPDWTKFTLKIFISKSLDDVYNAWTVPANLYTWFLEKAEYTTGDGEIRKPNESIQEGDKYEWKWNNWDVIEKGVVLKANGSDNVKFTFGNAGNVEINLYNKNGITEVLLTQDEIKTDENSKMNYYLGCSQGWTFWLTNLKAWLEHGILLNAKGISGNDVKFLVNS